MVTSPGGSWEVVPVHLKEQAHLLPPDFTSAAASDHDRHRLLGNSWHRGTASFLLKLVLQLGVHQIGQDAPGGEQHSAGGTKSFESILSAAREQPLPLTRLREPVGVEMYPPRDMWEHWHGSPHVVPRALLPASVEPAVAITLQRAAQVGPHLPAHREAVLQGLRALVDSLSDETDACGLLVWPRTSGQLFTQLDSRGFRYSLLLVFCVSVDTRGQTRFWSLLSGACLCWAACLIHPGGDLAQMTRIGFL